MMDDDGRWVMMMEEKVEKIEKHFFLKVVGDGLGTLVGVPIAPKKSNPIQNFNFSRPREKFGN